MSWIPNDGHDYTRKKDIRPLRLHLELKDKWLDDERREILRK